MAFVTLVVKHWLNINSLIGPLWWIDPMTLYTMNGQSTTELCLAPARCKILVMRQDMVTCKPNFFLVPMQMTYYKIMSLLLDIGIEVL